MLSDRAHRRAHCDTGASARRARCCAAPQRAETNIQRVRCRAVLDYIAVGRGCCTAAEPRERPRALVPRLSAGIRARWAGSAGGG